MNTPALHHHQEYDLKLHSESHIEALARHIFKNDPKGLQKVDKIYKPQSTYRLLPPKPRDHTFHHITQ